MAKDEATLIDTNVLLDLVTNDPAWAAWSLRQLEAATLRGPLVVNDVVYAELSVRYLRIEALDEMLSQAGIEVVRTTRAALFLAAKAFQLYRAAGGSKTSVLPDFFIGAHAAVGRLPLLTRDPRRYRTYFPTVALLSPEI